ncbi:MAG: thermonuclease family protein [Candidatus Omnitrophota bacterium]|nr:thermonuclease family protein [Candidatus Omnitrophota bacterium]MDZ4241708.1 thermonuclease family protein [Candidatus Omnitrophota bacterium]
MDGRVVRRVVLLALSLLACVSAIRCGAPTDFSRVKVVKVFDGDTLLLSGGEKVRLIGIDCPESFENDKIFRDAKRSRRDIRAIMAMGKESHRFAERAALGRTARLEFDAETRDRYGRLLAYVFLPAENIPAGQSRPVSLLEIDGQTWYFLNAAVVEEGYAVPMTIPPNTKYTELFRRLSREAREAGRGLWRDGVIPASADPA